MKKFENPEISVMDFNVIENFAGSIDGGDTSIGGGTGGFTPDEE